MTHCPRFLPIVPLKGGQSTETASGVLGLSRRGADFGDEENLITVLPIRDLADSGGLELLIRDDADNVAALKFRKVAS